MAIFKFDNLEMPLFIGNLFVILTNLAGIVTVKKKQLGHRFLSLMRLLFLVSILFQLTIIFFRYSENQVVVNYSLGPIRFFAGTIYSCVLAIFNLKILDGFNVINRIRSGYINGIIIYVLIQGVLIIVLRFFSELYADSLLTNILLAFKLIFGAETIFIEIYKSFKILRGLYVDKLGSIKGDKAETRNQYKQLNILFAAHGFLSFSVLVAWAIGNILENQLIIGIGEILNGILILWFPKLIMSFRLLRFGRSTIKRKEVKPRVSEVVEKTQSIKIIDKKNYSDSIKGLKSYSPENREDIDNLKQKVSQADEE